MDINPYTSPSADGFDLSAPGAAVVSNCVVDPLVRTRPWVLFLAVMVFIGSGFMLLAAVGMMTASVVGRAASNPGMKEMGYMMPVLTGLYLVLALAYIYPGVKLAKYAAAIRRVSHSRTESDLVAALDQQRGFWKFVGVVTILLIVAYFLLIAGMMMVGGWMASGVRG